MRRVAIVGVAVAVLGAACSGPQRPLSVGVREFPSNVLYGDPTGPVAPAPVPPTAFAPLPPAVFAPRLETAPAASPITPPPTTTTTVTTAPPVPCPTSDPRTAPRLEARNTITVAPRPATYAYRNEGSVVVDGPDAARAMVPAESTRTVQNVQVDADGTFTYDIVAPLAGLTTTTTYRVVPESSVPAGSGLAGLFIAGVTTDDGNQRTGFTPGPALKLLEFPAVPGTTWTSAGTDPVSQTTMKFTATVGQKARVDACGTPVDAVTVDLTDGKVVAPGQNLDFSASFAIATQYGGLSVRDQLAESGQEGLNSVVRKNLAVIAVEPRDPAS